MFRKSLLHLAIIILVVTSFSTGRTVEASAPVKGTFVSVTYEDVQLDKDSSEKRLKEVTIKNAQGRTITLTIDKFAHLTVDSRPVKIEAFKLGMEVEADVNLRRVKAMRGKTGTEPAAISKRDKVITATITQIDRNGKFLTVKRDDGRESTYFITNRTEFFKGTTLRDLSVFYEGDRVKLTLPEYDTNRLETVEIIEQGIKIEGLYKGTILRIDQTNNKLLLKDEKVFENWYWRDRTYKSTSSYTYSTKTPIYVGDEQIRPDRLRYYAGNEVHFVTIKQFGKEVIERMVIQKENERTFNEALASVNTKRKEVGLRQSGIFKYHDGTILIRNGRLVDPIALQAAGTAFIATDGLNKSRFANVIHIANDGLDSPNLVDHQIYFGSISSVSNNYGLTINNAYELKNNGWTAASTASFTFSNDTVAVEDKNNSVLRLIPQMDLKFETGKYGYFYVKDGNVVALHLIEDKRWQYTAAPMVSVGRLESVSATYPAVINVRNVSRWQQMSWKEAGSIFRMDIEQATIIRNGKVITAKELKPNDRLYILHESTVKGRIIFVD
ncbi:hypothetical protein MHZ92_08920 [Sporosarcina sp. ACRSL]|uniref:hypothetical protein n=1 Tax=Sporosarcina sp. ACRSL TaxID=2918215 RepID=UPI001EF6A6E7|nr:hypothetical protein [Sporosarcina sp. ACRSL]MCG7344254.1 hypothetical protein [Sporosarcina sp. ACRSL]